MANEHNKIKKQNWIARFNLIGTAKVNDYTFKIDEQSQKSSWIYNSMNLGVDCGKDYGNAYCSLMGGFSPERENFVYANSKDDFATSIKVAWEDRENDAVLEELHDMNFIKVGLEKTADGKTFTKRFLSPYDAIKYINKHLEDGMAVSVSGNIKYSMYNDAVQMNKEITSIYLYDGDTDKFHATFTQTVLVDKDSASLKNVDKATGIMPVDVVVLDYLKELNGNEIRGQFPYHTQFDYMFDMTKPELAKKIYDKLFKVKKGYTQITFEGDFVSGGSTVKPTEDELTDDIKGLIELGIYTLDEALEECSDNGSREFHMFLRKPIIRMVGDEDNKSPVLQMFEEQYDIDDLDMSWAYVKADDDEEQAPFDTDDETVDDDDLDWLNL